MLRAMIHKRPFDILYACAKHYVGYEYYKPYKPLRQALPHARHVRKPAEYKRAYAKRQQEKQPYAQHYRKQHRNAHNNAFNGFAELFAEPLFKPCRLLVYILARELRAFRKGRHAGRKRLYKRYHSPYYGKAEEGALLGPGGPVVIACGYCAVSPSYGHRHPCRGFHHYAFHNGLSAYAANLCHIYLFPSVDFSLYANKYIKTLCIRYHYTTKYAPLL